MSNPQTKTVTSAPPIEAIQAVRTLVSTSSVSLPEPRRRDLSIKRKQNTHRAAQTSIAAAQYVNALVPIEPSTVSLHRTPSEAKPAQDVRDDVSAMMNGYVSSGALAPES